MKKALLSILLSAMVVLSLSSCGKEPAKASNTETPQNSGKKFSDLTIAKEVGSFDDVWVDIPEGWRVDASETSMTLSKMNYFIVMSISREAYSFDELYENEMKSTLKHSVDNGSYGAFTPEAEQVDLNGTAADKFEGTLSMDNYGTPYEYPAYGYFLSYNSYPIMIMSVETKIAGEDKNSEEQRLEANKLVDEIVQTLRSEE